MPRFHLATLTGLLFALAPSIVSAQTTPRERISFDKNWQFALGNAADPQKDFGYSTVSFSHAKAGQSDGPASAKFDDRTWRTVDLPHDWAVELPFDGRGDSNHGSKAIGRNFPENSVGWYRKSFTVPQSAWGERIGIDFDGVYRDAQVWVNGFYLGTEPSGYTGFHHDLTDYMNYGGSNVIVVRADATLEEGWFYEGAGIYRHVWLTQTSPVHVAHDGSFVTSVVNGSGADVKAAVTLDDDTDTDAQATVEAQIADADGKIVATSQPVFGQIKGRESTTVDLALNVAAAKLWSLETPYLYKLVTTVKREGKVVDRYETPFGIRTIRWDPDKGFFLNGQHVEIKGTNEHQDHAGVGVAVPDDLNAFRIAQLKSFGSNAIRTSHNPPSPEFLDLCDRMGMLVLDENRHMGTTPEDYDHLKRMIERDRNHPSVILWSVGNEEWALEWSVFGERLTREMQAWVKRLDPTRPSTVALSGSSAGNSLSTEVFGYNYYLQHDMDKMHARFPTRPSVGTEESSSEHTRGVYFDDPDHQHLVAYDFEADGKHASIEEAWNYHLKRPFSAGLFYWTGFDYRGEPTPFGWPAISSQFGMVDTCGFLKDSAFLLQSFWTTKPMVHLLPHWDWPGMEGKEMKVVAYSNAEEVELLLNGASLGRKKMPANSHLEWQVKYAPGKLEAHAYTAGKQVAMDTVETTGAPAKLELLASQSKLLANGTSVDVLTVRALDAQGRAVPVADNLVSFTLSGPGKIIGVGNGDPASHEADKYVESVTAVRVSDWKTIATTAPDGSPETAATFDDSAWPKATDPRWDERRIDPEKSVFRGTFTLPDLPASATFKLELRSVGETQSIYLNGHLLGKSLKRDAVGYEYPLTGDLLVPGKNSVAIYAERFSGEGKKSQAFHWDDGGPAVVKVTVPAAQWRRSLFNGLAQVIVQSTGEKGEIKLTGTAEGLAGAVTMSAY
jgi:beta-galactosidase